MDITVPVLPQKAAPPLAAPIPLSSTFRPLFSTTAAGPSSKPISKPASTAPVDIDPQSQGHADTLARLGIKVRDFAYESKLPPIRPFRPRQIQPGPRPLKRNRRDGEDDDVFYINPKTGHEEGSSSKKARLEREITEPDIQQPSTAKRARGFMNLDDYEPEPQPESQSQPADIRLPTERMGNLSTSVTNHLSYSQLGMPQPVDATDATGTGLFGELTPMSSLSSIDSDLSTPPPPPQLPPKKSHSRLSTRVPKNGSPLRNSPLTRSSNKSPTPAKPATPPTHTSRYQLRKRPAPVSPQSPTKAGTRNRRTMYSPPHPLSRPIAYSMQSSHSRAKPQGASGSPRSRTLRSTRDDPTSIR
ncbi:hypothetical protein FPV67DRAFT_1664906 [Lyophyllum atratum]|nr:hypothetical protein FPV67DRAFT_1664906 [Lyophyllum atratum]